MRVFGNLILAIIARMFCRNHLKHCELQLSSGKLHCTCPLPMIPISTVADAFIPQ